MSQTNSAIMSIITQYIKQFVDKINELENENHQLKQKVDVLPSSLKADFDSLTERHSELKISYAEIERENTKMRQDMDQLIAQQNSLHSDIAKYFQQVVSAFETETKQTEPIKTPKKTCTIKIPTTPPSQKPLYREAKATTKLLNTEYESDSSDSETDDEMPPLIPACNNEDESENFVPRKLRFNVRADPNKSFAHHTNTEPINVNLSEILHKEEESSDDEKDDYEKILKQIITEGLMSGLENLNRSPQNAARFNTTRPDSRIGKRNRTYSANKINRPGIHVHPQSQTSKVRQAKTPEQTTSNFPFNFMFGQQGFTNPQGFTNTQANNNHRQCSVNIPQTSPSGNSNQNATHQQEAQIVQKILESLFNPNK